MLTATGAVFTVFIGVLGVVVGSFLNVVIHRVPAGLSVVRPRSSCPTCGTAIRARDNIPLVSWMLLRAKCRDCQTAISARYPLVELGTGLLFAAVSFRFGLPLDETPSTIVATIVLLIAYLYFAAISIALAAIDLDVHKLPNSIVLPAYVVVGTLLVAASTIYGDFSQLQSAAIGCGALFLGYLAMALVFPGGMGFGDVKLAGVIGLLLGFLGWGPLLVGAFSAFLLGGVFGLALIVSRRANRKSGIPFGPWMLGGAWLGILFGETIWNWYLSLFQLA